MRRSNCVTASTHPARKSDYSVSLGIMRALFRAYLNPSLRLCCVMHGEFQAGRHLGIHDCRETLSLSDSYTSDRCSFFQTCSNARMYSIYIMYVYIDMYIDRVKVCTICTFMFNTVWMCSYDKWICRFHTWDIFFYMNIYMVYIKLSPYRNISPLYHGIFI